MKTLWCMLGLLSFSLFGYAVENLQITPLSEISEDSLSEIVQGQHPHLAIEFPKGTKLPVRFSLNGDLVHFNQDEVDSGYIEIQQTLYARCAEEELFLSSNLEEWKPFLEFITGNAFVSFIINNQEPLVIFNVEANSRS